MANFAQSFDVTSPAGSSPIASGDDAIRALSVANNERINLEHYGLTESVAGEDMDAADAAGAHRPGYVSAVGTETLANILAMTPVREGVIWYATDVKTVLVYRSGAWRVLAAQTPESMYMVSAVLTNNTAFGLANGRVTLDVESYDYGSVFTLATQRYTAPVRGYYQFNMLVTLHFGSIITGKLFAMLKQYDVSAGTDFICANGSYARTNSGLFIEAASTLSFVASLDAGDYIEPWLTNTLGATGVVLQGDGNGNQTYFQGRLIARY